MGPDERIAAALERGDERQAATEAIRAYGPQVLGYLTRTLGSHDDAADAFSFFAERLWRGMAGFRGESSLRVWVYRVAWTAAMRVAGDGYRRRRERLRTTQASRLAAEVLTRPTAVREREAAEVDRLRSALDPAERSLLVLRVDRRLSWREVAEIVREEGQRVDEAALRKRFERLKDKLARLARGAALRA